MKFMELPLKGAFIIEPEPIGDTRGFFARTFCANSFKEHGLTADIAQCNISQNLKKGTLRGLHYQAKPHEEDKLVRVTRGALFDVIVDLRKDSSTFLKWVGVELTANNRKMIFIPKGFAHGFQTLEDNTEVFYQMSNFYNPEASRGLAWDHPKLAIQWPSGPRIISEKDQSYQNDVLDFEVPSQK